MIEKICETYSFYYKTWEKPVFKNKVVNVKGERIKVPLFYGWFGLRASEYTFPLDYNITQVVGHYGPGWVAFRRANKKELHKNLKKLRKERR